MIEVPYRGHYQTSDGRVVYAVAPKLADGTIKPGDDVKVGEVVITCDATEHWMSTSHPIVGVVARIDP